MRESIVANGALPRRLRLGRSLRNPLPTFGGLAAALQRRLQSVASLSGDGAVRADPTASEQRVTIPWGRAELRARFGGMGSRR